MHIPLKICLNARNHCGGDLMQCNVSLLFQLHGLHRHRCFSFLLLHSTNCIDSSPSVSLCLTAITDLGVIGTKKPPGAARVTNRPLNKPPSYAQLPKELRVCYASRQLQLLSMSISPNKKSFSNEYGNDCYHAC